MSGIKNWNTQAFFIINTMRAINMEFDTFVIIIVLSFVLLKRSRLEGTTQSLIMISFAYNVIYSKCVNKYI